MSILKSCLPVDIVGLILRMRLQRRNYSVLPPARNSCTLCGARSHLDLSLKKYTTKTSAERRIHNAVLKSSQLVAVKCVSVDEGKLKELPNNEPMREPKKKGKKTVKKAVIDKLPKPPALGKQVVPTVIMKEFKTKEKALKTLKTAEREMAAKTKLDDLLKAGKETSLNQILLAYLEICAFTDQPTKALHSLNYYRNRGQQFPAVDDISAFNVLLGYYGTNGNTMKMKEIVQFFKDQNLKLNHQSYASIFECLGRNTPTSNNLKFTQEMINKMHLDGLTLNDLFNKTTFTGNQHEMILTAIRKKMPSFTPVINQPNMDYTCPLLLHLNSRTSTSTSKVGEVFSPARGLISETKLQEMATKQFQSELRGFTTVKSIVRIDESSTNEYCKDALKETEAHWTKSIADALERNVTSINNQSMVHRNQRLIDIKPFLQILSVEDCTNILMREIRKLAEGSESYSPGVSTLHREIGEQVLARYDILYKKQAGILEEVDKLYRQYVKWYLNPTTGQACNSRQKWQELLFDPNSTGPTVDVGEKVWPNSIVCTIGRFLYDIIMRDIKINANITKNTPCEEQIVPAFYSIFRVQGYHMKEEIKPHPSLVKLIQMGSQNELTFESTMVPMLCPPLPWASIRTGGYLLSAAKIVRLPYQAHQQKLRLQDCYPEDLYPSLDSLNQLGNVPWRINERMLDTIIDVFNNKGDESLAIPPPPSECPVAPHIEPTMDKEEKVKIYRLRQSLKRKKAEMFSLWCDALYRLSIANHFRKEIFWFPQNMDFRGRVYPCPPHLNHLGSDAARSILVFAKGEPLGPHGLDWLKIHAINLTGLKKREPLRERLAYANSIIDKILDSADNPLEGAKWWAESDEPWQTLACCMEIANAMRSGDHESYISHFPVHQDGSCNGLQHYAALGRDHAGAESVNLVPSDRPQDVYNAVAKIVEKLRKRDANNGNEIAQVLEGFITRKVIKQTVMTTVYGVTRYGARLQIAKQLKDLTDFPKQHLWPASIYLVSKTFDSLQEMFTSTKEIQDWFTECARLISQVCGQNVEWVTPMGLPIVQPYFKPVKEMVDPFDPLKLKEVSSFDMFERPNVMKQKNAFPPNFIHSLDSSHMMLTSLHCERAKLTFAAVHDCYWTHPVTVETMNRICREQFVVLHSQPLLEDLSNFLVNKYSYKDNEMKKDGSLIEMTKSELNRTLRSVPPKGTLDLKSVLKSVYFFS